MTQATSCNPMAISIQQQIHDQFQVREHDDLCMIITPMLYPDNSRVCIFFEAIDSRHFLLTDHGEASAYAFVHGVPEDVMQDQIRDTMIRFHLSDTGSGELMLEVEQSEIAKGIFTLIQAVQDIGYLVYSRGTFHTQPA